MPRVDIHVGDLWLPDATSYSITEDSTPVDPSDTTGGFGQATFAVLEKEPTSEDPTPSDKFLMDKEFTLDTATQGTTTAIVKSIGNSNKITTITADSRMSQLGVIVQAARFVGTLGDALRYYLGLVEVTAGIVIDDALEGVAVDLPGWNAEVWFQISKKLAPVYRFEISLVSNNIVFRPWRTRVAVNYRDSQRGWSLDRSQVARAIEGYAYNGTARSSGLAYPQNGWNKDVTIYQVDAREHLSFDIAVNGSLTSIVQPVAVDYVDKNEATHSVYSVSGGDGLPYPAAEWHALGGAFVTTISDDTRSIHVELQGPDDDEHAPYRIAVGSSASDYYSSVRILGTGLFFDKQLITINTPVDPTKVTQAVGVTIDNEFINTSGDFYDAAIWSLAAWTGPKRAYSASTLGINRVGDSGSYAYPTIAEFNAQFAGQTIAQFNAQFADMTIADFNAYELSLVSGRFENQAFGNIAGARVYDDWAWNRIRSATIGPAGVSYTAEADTTIADFNEVWANKTIADFNAFWYGHTMLDFTLRPLWNPDVQQFYIPTGYGYGLYGAGPYGGGY